MNIQTGKKYLMMKTKKIKNISNYIKKMQETNYSKNLNKE